MQSQLCGACFSRTKNDKRVFSANQLPLATILKLPRVIAIAMCRCLSIQENRKIWFDEERCGLSRAAGEKAKELFRCLPKPCSNVPFPTLLLTDSCSIHQFDMIYIAITIEFYSGTECSNSAACDLAQQTSHLIITTHARV